jgi:hypothetical protein
MHSSGCGGNVVVKRDWHAEKEHYRANLWTLISGFIDAGAAADLAEAAVSSKTRRVTVGASERYWTEHDIHQALPIRAWIAGETASNLVTTVLDAAGIEDIHCWSHRYEVGEFIPWHKDGSGSTQLLICLRAAPPGCGGEFLMRNRPEPIRLDAGDALLFRATEIEHATAPIVATTAHPHPRRIVAVSRFFCS